MSNVDPPGGSGPKPTLPHGDPVAVELTSAIHGGDLAALRRLLAERPELASARMIGRKGLEGGWRTPLHAAADWPGYFPAAPSAVALLLKAGADPNDDTGGDRPETPLHWAASTDDVEVAVTLIDGGAQLETPGGSIGTPLDNAIGYSCWHVARLLVASGAKVNKLWHAAALGMMERVEQLLGDRTEAAGDVSQGFWHACAGGQRRAAEYLLAQGADLNWVPEYAEAPLWTRPASWAPAGKTSSAGCGSEAPSLQSPQTEPIAHGSTAPESRQVHLDAQPRRQANLDAVFVVPDVDQLKQEIRAGTPVEQLAGATELAERLRARGDELLDHFVDAARAGGASWSEIGCALGTSKQAAQQKFAALADPPPGQAPFGLTGTAADVLRGAVTQARELGTTSFSPST